MTGETVNRHHTRPVTAWQRRGPAALGSTRAGGRLLLPAGDRRGNEGAAEAWATLWAAMKRESAACAGDHDPSIWQRRDRRDDAIEICNSCPLLDVCADYGRFEHWGVWGGRWRGPAWGLHRDEDDEDDDVSRRDPDAERCPSGHRLELQANGTRRRRCRPCKARREREGRRVRREAEQQGDQVA